MFKSFKICIKDRHFVYFDGVLKSDFLKNKNFIGKKTIYAPLESPLKVIWKNSFSFLTNFNSHGKK